ncbi:MAG: uracil-DNA glycosylase [Defluviitaleaceae bacterium]|nr:uracil-DNA glycosylase [Defluviitaleaceae bacterium]
MKQDWKELLTPEREKDYFKKLQLFTKIEYANKTVYPPKDKIFTAFSLTSYYETKIVILGQDPYHGKGQAHGLSFSVEDKNAKFPPSLRNMFKELETDTGIIRSNQNLTDWANQGVLMLNTVLTVRASEAGSHRGQGWEVFTDSVISKLNDREDPVIFILWGADAKKKISLITNKQHKLITGVHPSPLSAHGGFFGSKPYSKANSFLTDMGKSEIKWG